MTKKHRILRRALVQVLLAVLLGLIGGAVLAAESSMLEPLTGKIEIQPGQVDFQSGQMKESEIYGSIAGYVLKKGHTLSISDENYVFSVRQLIGGNYNTMLKAATAESFTATEDMTIACLIRKPDRSALAEGELAGIFLVDTLFDMADVPGNVHRFTVEAEKIDGGTATTRAAIFLPESYSDSGTPTRLVIMTNGYHGHLTDSVWNANKPDDVALMKHYMEVGYAVLVVDNTARWTSSTPDAGCPQQVSGYFKAYEYVQRNLNVEQLFSLHARSQGNLVALRIMREHPELVKCALMAGSQLSFKQVWDSMDRAFLAQRFGFEDTTGNTYEADKVIGYDPYTDADGAEYDLPPTFWMMAQSDASSLTLSGIEKIKAHGNDVTTKVYTGTDHSGVCRLNIAECWEDALAYLEAHQTGNSEHNYCAWEVVKEATCTESGQMRRVCADCGHTETWELAATQKHAIPAGTDFCASCGKIWLTELSKEIPVQSNKLQINGTVLEDAVYGHIRDYHLKQGHTLSISSEEHVFSVRQLLNGDYSTMLKQATAEGYTAKTDITVGAWIRRPDSSELAEGELAGIYMIDSIYGMVGVPGNVHRFTVEAEKIDGGTATTRAAIFLPESYSDSGAPTRLVIMTNGYHGHLTDSVWNANKPDDVALMKHYMEAGYAVLVVDNTTKRTSSSPDWGNPQLVSSYFEAYEYVQARLNVEEQFFLHSRSMGTFAAMRIMRQHPELVKCAIMCGPVLSLRSRFSTDPAYIAKQFGFDDTTGATYEADKVVGYDPATDVNGVEYSLPPTFWMMAEVDAESIHLTTIEKIKNYGNEVTSTIYTDTDHSGVCRLNIAECWEDAQAFFESHQTSRAEHRYCAWKVVREATHAANGLMRRDCADCDHYETMELPASEDHVYDGSSVCTVCGDLRLESLSQTISLTKGHFDQWTDGIWVDSDVYGCVIGYRLQKGHTLSISDESYVFSVRQLIGDNYGTLIKATSADSFTATEDMTVAIRVRKPDSSTLTAEELAEVFLVDTLYGMTDVAGFAHRFTVEAERIDGGTATTRAAIFLPETYRETGDSTPLIVMTNGYSAYLTDSVWNTNSDNNVGIICSYLEAGYAVYVVDNTAARTAQTPDLGCPQLVDSYWKAYEYIQKHFNMEQKMAIHSRSFGTFAAARMMQERPELIRCAVMTGPRVSFELAYSAVDKAFVAERFGFDDATGATYEADKLVGYDPYTDVNGAEYRLPPTFWMMASGDATTEPSQFIEKLTAHGNSVLSKTYSGIDHSGICTLNQTEPLTDALAFLAGGYEESHLPGDINGDGKVNNKDASRLFQYLSDWDVTVVEAALDVNGDGKVNNKDATRLFQYLSGWNVTIH